MNKAFTLIELLVVVLIIGILAAIALPQYEKAVARSRSAEAMIILTALVNAEQRYYLANGDYTRDYTALDVEIKNSNSFTFSCTNDSSELGPGKGGWRCSASSANYNVWFEFALAIKGRWCAAYGNNVLAEAICNTYGVFSHTHSVSGTKYYLVD